MTASPEDGPLVSVIMPTYQQAEYIGEAIQSVLNQTYGNLELIIVDNFSNDETEDIVVRFPDARIRYIKFDNKGIIAAGRNHAVSHAKGSVLAFLDSDDVWAPEKLKKQLPHLKEPSICIVSSNFEPIGYTKFSRHHLRHISGASHVDFEFESILAHNPIMTSSAIIQKALFDSAGGFDENPDYRYIEDWELWLRITKKGKVRVLGARLLHYRLFEYKHRDLRDVEMRSLALTCAHAQIGDVSERTRRVSLSYRNMAVGRACLDVGDLTGFKYFKLALMQSVSLPRKLQALLGMALFYVPRRFRAKILANLYHWANRG